MKHRFNLFYDFEIGEKIEILTRAEAEAALKGGQDDGMDIGV